MVLITRFGEAGIAQLVEQLTCNQQVTGSIPVAGSVYNALYMSSLRWRIISEFR
jgi:hypothetical protein